MNIPADDQIPPAGPIPIAVDGSGVLGGVHLEGEASFPEDDEGQVRFRVDYSITNGSGQDIIVGDAVSTPVDPERQIGFRHTEPDPENAWLTVVRYPGDTDDLPAVGLYSTGVVSMRDRNYSEDSDEPDPGDPLYMVAVPSGGEHSGRIDLPWPLVEVNVPSVEGDVYPPIPQPVEQIRFIIHAEPLDGPRYFGPLEVYEDTSWFEVRMIQLTPEWDYELIAVISLVE